MSKIPILDGTTDYPKIRLNHLNLKSTGLLVLISPFLWWKVRTSPTNLRLLRAVWEGDPPPKAGLSKKFNLWQRQWRCWLLIYWWWLLIDFFIINPSQWSMIPSQSQSGLLNVTVLPGRKAEEDEEPKDDRPAALYLGRWTGCIFCGWTCGGKPTEIDGEGPVKDGEGLFFPLKNEMKWLWHGYLGLFSWKSLKSWWWIIWNLKSSFSHEKWRWHSYIIMQGMPHFQKGPFVVWTFHGKPLNLVT